jgi:hypothetical protein
VVGNAVATSGACIVHKLNPYTPSSTTERSSIFSPKRIGFILMTIGLLLVLASGYVTMFSHMFVNYTPYGQTRAMIITLPGGAEYSVRPALGFACVWGGIGVGAVLCIVAGSIMRRWRS